MLKLKLQYFGHLMQRANSLEKTLMLGKIEGRRRRRRQRMKWLDGITDSMEMSLSKPISFRMDWMDLLAVQGTLKSLLQHRSSSPILNNYCSNIFKDTLSLNLAQ